MSVLTHVNSKSLHGGYHAVGDYHSMTIPAVASGNKLVVILMLASGEAFTSAPATWDGVIDTPLVYLTQQTAGSDTWRLYELDNITNAPTAIRWKLNAENFTYADAFEIGGTSGVAPTLKANQKTSLLGGTSFSQAYTATTSNEFVIAHLAVGSGGVPTPSAPFALVPHGNYGFDSFYNANAGAIGGKTLDWVSSYSTPTVWIVSFGNSLPPPTVTSVTSSGVTEGGNMVFTATLSGATSGSTNYAFSLGGTATAGTDYTSPLTSGMCNNDVTVSGSDFVVPDATSSWTVTIPTTQDTTDEDNETIVLTVGGTASTGGTITDDDAPPTVSISDATESFGTVTHTLTLSQASGKTITVQVDSANGSKTAGTHYTAIVAQTVTFNPGETEQTVQVTVL